MLKLFNLINAGLDKIIDFDHILIPNLDINI